MPDGFWLSFVSPEGRASRDVALVHISDGSQVGAVYWLTDTAAVQESSTKLARYGGEFLAAWQAGGGVQAALVDATGAIRQGPETIDTAFNQQTDFVSFSNGDVGWAHGAGSSLTVYRLRFCR